MIWNKIKDKKPFCYESGDWHGKKSDQLLFCDCNNYFFVGTCYEGNLDGESFFDIYDENGLLLTESVVHWMEIPKLI